MPRPGLLTFHLNGSPRREKFSRHFAKIFHRWAENGNLAECSRLENVVPARGNERASYEDSIGKTIHSGKLAEAVE